MLSFAGMKTTMDFLEAFARDVGVDLSGADAGVAKHLLDRAKIGAIFEQVRGKAMTKHVRRDIFLNAATFHPIFDMKPHRDTGKSCAAACEEYGARGARFDEIGPGVTQVATECFNCGFADGNYSLFVSLADDADEPGIEMQLLQAEGAQFSEAQT